MNESKITLDDIDEVIASSSDLSIEEPLTVRAAPVVDPTKPRGFIPFVKTAAKQDWLPIALARIAAQSDLRVDVDFNLGEDVPEAEWNELTNGLDEETKDKIAGAAFSRHHLYNLVDLATESQQAEAEMAGYGVWGVAGRVATSIADPSNLALAIGTGGIGVIAKAERLTSVARSATTLANQRAAVTALGEIVPKVGTLSSAVRTGLVTGAESAALESLLVASSPDRDGWDVAYAGIGGLAMGTAVGKVLSSKEALAVRRTHAALKAKLETDELTDFVTTRRGEITAALGNVEEARTQVGKAVGDAAVFLSERDADVSSYSQFRRILESGGRADAKAATSSATGIDQFTEGTWLGMVAKEKPAWASGLTREQLLDLRKDPSKSAEMVSALDRDSTEALRKAGAPVNHYTLYAMHHFGEQKGKRFALAEDSVNMEDILSPAQLNANAYLKGKTKAEAISMWTQRAKRGGWDLAGAVDAAGASKAELRAQDIAAGFDRGTTEARLREIEDTLSVQEGLRADAADALKHGELRKLQREADDLRAELGGARKSRAGLAADGVAAVQRQIDELIASRDSQLRALHAEDAAKMGQAVADSKPRAKLRESVVDRRIAEQRKNLDTLLAKAKDTQGRARYAAKSRLGEVEPRLQADAASAIARAELKRIEGLNKGGALDAEGAALREALGMGEQAAKDVAAAATRRSDTSGLLKLSQSKEADLDKLDALDNLQGAAEIRRQSLEARGVALGYPADTLSAARVVGFDAGLHAGLEGTSSGPVVGKMKLAGGVRMFGHGTFAGILRGSDSEVVRTELGVLVGNSLGEVGDTVTTIGASEIANRIQKTLVGKWSAAVSPAYDAWLKENGISRFAAYSRGNRETFMRQVGLAVRGETTESSHVTAAAKASRLAFAEFLKEAKAAGVKGFENVEINDNYLPRVFDFHAFHRLNERVGPDQLGLLIQKGIQELHPELEDKIARRIGDAYVTRMRELRVGSDAGMMQGMSFDDIGFLRQFLGDAKLGSEEIEEVVGAFAAAKRGSADVLNQEGNFRHAKMRQKFDENFALDLRDVKANDGSQVRVTISDLFENNVEALMGRYSRTLSGHIGLAKIGIKSRADFAERMHRVERALENDPDQLKSVKRMGESAYALLTSQPLENAGLWSDLGRTGRDMAYAAQMENVGLSNIPDLASLLAYGNFKYTSRAFFGGDVFGAMWKRDGAGRLLDAEWREIEETFGAGTDFLSNQVFSSYVVDEDFAQSGIGNGIAAKVSSGFATVGHAARVTGRAVSAGSGLAAITSMSQRIAARNAIYRIKEDVLRGGGFSKVRSASLGLDEPMKERIAEQFRKHTGKLRGEFGDEVETSNFQLWDDHDARDALLYAVHRETKKNVQEEDLGDTLLLQHKGIGKVITQFRRFGLTAWTKQTLRGIAEHDAETASRVLMQFTLAAGVWKLRNELILAGMEASGTDAAEVERFRTEKLAPDRIAAAGIRNAGFAALLPDAYDTAADFAFDSPFFNVRNSGLSSNALSGIPLYSLTATAGRAASGTFQAATRGDRQFDQRDAKAWQALVPFGNHLLVAPAIDAMISHLPARDEDEDKESIQWIN